MHTQTRRYNSIDLLKFVLAFLIISNHIEPFGINNDLAQLNHIYQDGLSRFYVGFFFVAAGFFLMKKIDPHKPDRLYFKKYLFKTGKLYVVWSAIYLPLCWKVLLKDERGLGHGILEYFRRFFFSGSYSQLWFLNGLFVGVLILMILVCLRWSWKRISVLAGILYLIGLLGQTWYGLLQPLVKASPDIRSFLEYAGRIFETTRNGVFFAFPLLCIGMLFAWDKVHLTRNTAITGLACSYAGMVTEFFLVEKLHLAKSYDMYLLQIPVVFFLFALTLAIEPKAKLPYGFMRKMSMLIYCIHLWAIAFVTKGGPHLGLNLKIPGLAYLLTALLSFGMAVCIIRLSDVPKFRFLKHLM